MDQSSSNEIAISVKDLTVARSKKIVLPSLSIDIYSKRITGLLGPSGGGKSTLIRAIVGVQRIKSGAVSVLGMAAGSAPLRRKVGYVTQAPSVYQDLTVGQNLRYFARILNVDRDRINEVLEIVDLSSYANRGVDALSGGQRARVSLATALLNNPEVLVLDEPTVGLDPLLRKDLWHLFKQLADEGKTLLISSHVMDEADRCDSLILLREGKVLAHDTPAHLREQTETESVENAFLSLIADDRQEDNGGQQ